MRIPRTWIAASLLGLGACAHDPYEQAVKADTPEAYQRYLRENPDDRAVDEARSRLAELRFNEARQAHTVLAYKRFVEDFPTSEQAADAVKLLESLRFSAAEQLGTVTAYQDFLRDHPEGAHAAQARTAMQERAFSDAKAAGTAEAMRDFLRRFPESSHKGEAEQLADDRAFAEARAQGPAGIALYVERATEGAHREEARSLLQAGEAEAVAAGGNLAEADALAQHVRGPEGDALRLRLAERELEEVAARLDASALRALAKRRPEIAEKALAVARELDRDPKRTQALRAQISNLDPMAMGRPVDELQHVLDTGDPRDRWLAAEELGALGATQAFDKLLDSASDARFEEIRVRAFGALQLLAGKLGPDATTVEARRRLDKLRKMASGPRMFLKIALTEELAGLKTEARADYQRALRGGEEDLLALRRLIALEGEHGGTFAQAVDARRLSATVEEQVKVRSGAEGQGDPPLLAARWFCGAVHDAEVALAALEKLPPAATRDFPDDVASFTQQARAALSMARARLADAEEAARTEKPSFVGCEVDEVAQRMADGVKLRLSTVAALVAAKSLLAQYPLREVARRDPAPEVREAAKRGLAGLTGSPVAQGGR